MEKIIKIFHIVYSFETIGGLENGLINIVNGSDRNNLHHVICSLTTVGRLVDRISNENVVYYSLRKKEGNDLTLPFKIYRILKKESPDVVHLRNWPTMVEGFIAAKMAGVKKIIYSEHGRHFESVWKKQHLKTAVIRFILNHVDQCLCVSNDVAAEMKKLYRLDRDIDVILNGVDTNKFKSLEVDNIKEINGWTEAVNVGSVGRLDKGKRYDELISDFTQYIRDLNLIIIGDGPEFIKLSKLVHNIDKQKKVYLIGNVDNVNNILNCLDIFVLPSESEGLSNAIMEAMSCGLPIVAYDVGGNKELVMNGDGGFLINEGGRKTFVDKVKYLSQNKDLMSKMGGFNRDYIEKNYSIHTMIKKYTALYIN